MAPLEQNGDSGCGRAHCGYVDDLPMPGGVIVLDAFDPDQMYRVEVYPLLHQVRLYTTHYVESLALSGRTLPPICIVC